MQFWHSISEFAPVTALHFPAAQPLHPLGDSTASISEKRPLEQLEQPSIEDVAAIATPNVPRGHDIQRSRWLLRVLANHPIGQVVQTLTFCLAEKKPSGQLLQSPDVFFHVPYNVRDARDKRYERKTQKLVVVLRSMVSTVLYLKKNTIITYLDDIQHNPLRQFESH